jgi:hypothetical protein
VQTAGYKLHIKFYRAQFFQKEILTAGAHMFLKENFLFMEKTEKKESWGQYAVEDIYFKFFCHKISTQSLDSRRKSHLWNVR